MSGGAFWALLTVVNALAPGATPGGGPPGGADVTSASPLVIEAVGTCPTGEAVRAALLPALVRPPAGPLLAPPRVSDLGDHFKAVAAGQTGEFVDRLRDCAERARVAAVFIALALSPPTAPERPPPRPAASPLPPPLPPQPEVQAPLHRPAPYRWIDAALALRIDAASVGAPAEAVAAWGAELRVAVGRGAFGLAARAALLTPTIDTLGSVSVREQRFPLGLALAFAHALRGRFYLDADAGLAIVPFTLQAQGLSAMTPATRVDVGVGLGVALRFPALARQVAPFIGLHAELFPRPYTLAVDPLGDIGSANRLWLGGTIGIVFGQHRL